MKLRTRPPKFPQENREVEFTSQELNMLAWSNFERFIALLYYLTIEKGIQFDVVLSAGDSGIVMADFVRRFYKTIHKKLPVVIPLPSFRFKDKGVSGARNEDDYFDNTVLSPIISEKLKDISKVQNILFVDDEIGSGYSAKICIDVLKKAVAEKIASKPDYVLIAENHWFKWEWDTPDLNVHFYPYGKKIMGYNNVITKIVPPDILAECQEKGVNNLRLVLNTLLNIGSKRLNEQNYPVFEDSETSKIKAVISDFDGKQKGFEEDLQLHIEYALKRYKANVVDLLLEHASNKFN